MDKQIPLSCAGCGTDMGYINVDEKYESLISAAETFCMDCPDPEEEEEGS